MKNNPSQTSPPPDAIILAAGRGTRMGGDLPKVLLEVAGKPMLRWVVAACHDAGVTRCVIVIGYGGNAIRSSLAGVDGCLFGEQQQQLGTGHAARMAQPLFDGVNGHDVFVLAGDGPLIRGATLTKMLQTHRSTASAATMATAVIDDPTGYGRIKRSADNRFEAIIEQTDATDDELMIREINPSYYCFSSQLLFDALARIDNDNKQREYYLTDVPALLQADGKIVTVMDTVPPEDVLSINTPQELKRVDQILRHRA